MRMGRLTRVRLPNELHENADEREQRHARVDELERIGRDVEGPLREVISNEDETQKRRGGDQGAQGEPEIPESIVVAQDRVCGRGHIGRDVFSCRHVDQV
jgi:hypothetical protein